jgi:phage-related protein
MPWTIEYYSLKIQRDIETLSKGLFELRLKSREGIACVFYCTIIERRIVLLHSFIKKTDRTPPAELETAKKRMKEVIKNALP